MADQELRSAATLSMDRYAFGKKRPPRTDPARSFGGWRRGFIISGKITVRNGKKTRENWAESFGFRMIAESKLRKKRGGHSWKEDTAASMGRPETSGLGNLQFQSETSRQAKYR